jgi:hypothetical protein
MILAEYFIITMTTMSQDHLPEDPIYIGNWPKGERDHISPETLLAQGKQIMMSLFQESPKLYPHPQWVFLEEESQVAEEIRHDRQYEHIDDFMFEKHSESINKPTVTFSEDGMTTSRSRTIDLNQAPVTPPESTIQRQVQEDKILSERLTARWDQFIQTVRNGLNIECKPVLFQEIAGIYQTRYVDHMAEIHYPNGIKIIIRPASRYFTLDLVFPKAGIYQKNISLLQTLAKIPSVRAHGHAGAEDGLKLITSSRGIPLKYRTEIDFHIDSSEGLYAFLLAPIAEIQKKRTK